jgi:iron complex outermembrane receptor protein
MDAHVVKAADRAIEGKTPANVAEKQARAYLEYEVPAMPGLSVSGGVSYCGIRWVDAVNSEYIPAVRLYDAGVRYRHAVSTHSLIIVCLNIANLLNTTCWAAYKPSGTVGLCLGAPRLITLSVKYELLRPDNGTFDKNAAGHPPRADK